MGIDRKDIDDKYKWKIDLMYSSQESLSLHDALPIL